MRVAVPLLLALLLAAPAAAQIQPKEPPPAPPPREPVPGVRNPDSPAHVSGQIFLGERAPDFELDGSRGRAVMLSRLRGDYVLLVFADRKEDLAKLVEVDSTFTRLAITLVGVCKEKAYVLERFVADEHLRFLMLADVTGEVAAMYGIYDSLHGRIDPGLFVLDRHGIVRSAFVGYGLPPGSVADIARYAVVAP